MSHSPAHAPVWNRDSRRNSAPCFSKIAFPCLAALTISSGLSLLKRANCTIAITSSSLATENYLMRLRAHAGALQRRLNTAAMPLPVEARNGRTAPPLGCKEKRHWPARRQAAGSASLMIRYVIVVYKVDRLTRSLADFAKLVELFDAQGVSFVSVTQQFNTTTSMGRLTLNVLLSFAQFEREVTSERIRDKIAASKRKGLWVGGPLPLGYEMKDGKVAVVEDEAERVRL